MDQVNDRPPVRLPEGWRFAQPVPCATCPFRSDLPFYLRPERAEGIAGHLRGGGGFTCHKTAEWDDGTWVRHTGERQCAGALATVLAEPVPIELPDAAQLAARLGLWDPATLQPSPVPVYPGLAAWVAAVHALHNTYATDPKDTP